MALFMDPPVGAPPYLSQALRVVNKTGGSTQPVDRAQLDTANQFVQVSVNNNGQSNVSNAIVQWWACAFSAGMAKSLFLPSAGSTVGRQLPADTVLVGVNHTFEDPNQWKPTTAEIDAAGLRDPANPAADIHACLFGNVFSPGVDGAQMTVQPPNFSDIATNGHHAQRNMALFYAPGQTIPPVPMNIWMHVGNADPKRAREFQLTITERGLGRQLEPLVAQHLQRDARIEPVKGSLARGAIPGLAVRIGGELRPILPAKTPLEDLRIEVAARKPAPKLVLEPDGFAGIRLLAKLPKEGNVLRIFDVDQTLDGRSVGGARVLFLNVPDKVKRQPASVD